MEKMLKFDLPKNQSSIIKVIGIGGGGSNAVSHMFEQGIEGVDFIICNTDAQALEASGVTTKVQLGTKGLGAGSVPAVGKEAAIENIEELKQILEKNTKMIFITAGMGGGTGTGAAPVIAEAAKSLGILTVGIVTLPFAFEGRKRKLQAEAGIEELKKYVDTLLIIGNDKLRQVHGDLKLSDAFKKADNILTTAAKGIAEIITVTGYINVDFEDVKTVMEDSGTAIMGSATAEGENRAIEAIEQALSSPLLNDNQIKGASNILLYIGSGEEEVTMDEVTEITDYIQDEAGQNAEIIWGNGNDPSLGNMISITLVATGFSMDNEPGVFTPAKRKVVIPLRNEIADEPLAKTSSHEPVDKITLISSRKESGEVREEQKNIVMEFPSDEEKEAPITEITLKRKEIKAVETPVDNVSDTELKEEVLNSIQQVDNSETEITDFIEKGEIEKKSKERIKKLKDLSMKLRTPGEVEKMENTPAYIRRNVELSEVKHSSEPETAHYTLSEGKDNKVEIKSSNSFLHDNVD